MTGATKMKKVQKQKRWAGSGLAAPPAFRAEVAALAGGAEGAGPDLQRFSQLLLALVDQRNAYAEIEALKPLTACALECGARAASEAGGGGGDQQQQQQQQQQSAADLGRMQSLLARLMLLPNARPLHKQLLAGLRPLLLQQQQQAASSGFAAAAAACCAQLAAECLQLQAQPVGGGDDAKQREQEVLQPALRLGSALAALLASPECKPALVTCAVPSVAAMAAGLQIALRPAAAATASGAIAGPAATAAVEAEGAAEAAAAITTDVMEALQDCISALYFMLSAFGQTILEQQPEAAAGAVAAAGQALLVALQGQALVRESLASAAVALYAAVALPAAEPAALARCFAEGLVLGVSGIDGSSSGSSANGTASGGELQAVAPLRLLLPGEAAGGAGGSAPAVPCGLVDAWLRARQGGTGASLASELQRLPAINRICAIRGLAGAMPAEVSCAPLAAAWPAGSALAAAWPGGEPQSRWLLLVDGVLPAISAAIQSTTDEHFRFHAFASLFVALERIRTQQQAAVAAALQEAGPPAAAGAASVAPPLLAGWRREQLLGLLWSGFEAPLSQTLHRVHTSFECLLDIIALQPQLGAASQPAASGGGSGGSGGGGSGSGSAGEELDRIARGLLALDVGRKGRYAPLQALVPRLGAGRLLGLQPGLVPACLGVMDQHLISSAVASFLLALIAQLQREDCEHQPEEAGSSAGVSAAGGPGGQAGWRASWLPPLAEALGGSSEGLRDHVAAHLLPSLLSLDPPALGLLLRSLMPGGQGVGGAGAGAGCLAVLKAARKQQMLADLDAVPAAGLDAAAVRGALLAAVRSCSEGLRIDALTMVCAHPKTTTLPTPLELEVAAEAVRLTLRCDGSSLRHKTLGPLGKLLIRQRGAVATALSRRHPPEAVLERIAEQRAWLHWFARTLLASLYPGASHQRSFMALELLGLLLEAFGDLINPELPPPTTSVGLAKLRPHQFEALPPELCSEGTVQLLLAAALDSSERLRESAAAVLLRLPTPLPGAGSPAALQPLLARVLCLLRCPRGREADAGAQLTLLLLRKYGGGGGSSCCWHLDIASGTAFDPAAAAAVSSAAAGSSEASPAEQQHAQGQQAQERQQEQALPERQAAALWCFLSSACQLLESRVAAAQADMLEACRGGLAQGPLLALRYAVPHVPWRRLAEAPAERAAGRDWPALVARLLAGTYAVVDLTLPLLSKPQDHNNDAADVDADDMVADDCQGGEGGEGGADALGPRAQVINTACWQSSAGCGLLLGALARALPIGGPAALLTPAQLSLMADRFTGWLCELKHNGAVDKTQQGFALLCERLLQVGDPALRQLPQACLTRVLAFVRRPGQGRGDIVRRSAGLPFATNAIFFAEPECSPKVLLQRGMHELLATAGDEGLESWPRVHALNCLRAAFQDGSLAMDTSAHLAAALQTAILGMAAPQWEVRNAASLCYTALLVRVLGFRNASAKGGTVEAKRAPTAADFFARHPTLHPFLLAQLEAATEALEGADGAEGSSAEGAQGAGQMHPSMFPVLVLLSRLRSSQHNRLAGGAASSSLLERQLSPAAFAPLVQRCAAARAAAVRQLAATSLPPLLAPEARPAVAAELAEAVAEGVASAAAAARGGQAAALKPSFNVLHGQLMQLRALLESAAAADDPAAAAALLAAVSQPLAACAPAACTLGSGTSAGGHYVPAAVSLEYVRAAEVAVALLPAAQRAEGEEGAEAAVAAAVWLSAVQRRCWVEIERSGLEPPAPDARSPMLSCAFKHAAQLCFALLLQQQQRSRPSAFGASPGLLPQLASMLRSERYEVRGAALKVLLRHVAAAAAAGQQPPVAQAAQLRSLLRQQLRAEGHHKAQRRLLALLALLPPTAVGAAAVGTAAGTAGTSASTAAPELAAEFSAMLARASQAADSRVRQHAVECLGPLLAQLLEQQGGLPGGDCAAAAAAAQAAAQLLGVVRECSQPWQLPDLRLAAASAAATCGLLRLNPRQSVAAGDAAAEAWDALVTLLEDEEDGVREASTQAAAAAMPAFEQQSGASADSSGSSSALAAQPEPGQPSKERLLRRVLPALAARCGPHPALLALLCRRCCPDAAAAAGVPGPALAAGSGGANAAAAAAAAADRAERLFDREPENTHEEPLLLAQLAAGELARLLPQASGAAAAQVQAWAGAALAELQRMAAALEQSSSTDRASEDGSSGGVLVLPPYHQHFAELYCAWLALWAASHLRACDDSWAASTAAVVAALAGGAAGPAAARASVPQLADAAAAAAAAWQRGGEGGGPAAAGDRGAALLFLV